MRWGLLVLIIGIIGVWCVYFASSIVADDKLVVAIIITTFLVAAYPGYHAILNEEEIDFSFEINALMKKKSISIEEARKIVLEEAGEKNGIKGT